MWGRATLLVLLTWLVLTASTIQALQGDKENQLKVGKSIDLFTRYGYLTLTMKVISKNETNWFFREPTIDIFADINQFAVYPERFPKKRKRIFEGDFHIEFCDNVGMLFQAYFRGFSFELLDHPWKAFVSSWTADTIGNNLGINSSYIIADQYFYVLVRLARFREIVQLEKIPDNIILELMVAREIEKIRIGDVESVLTFIKKYGSHYINAYVTGNSLYQVFVFNKTNYHRVKDRLKKYKVVNISNLELSNYFSPWYAEHMGTIKVASGNCSVANWTLHKLRYTYSLFGYPSLLKINGDPRLLSRLNVILGNEAILEMNMKTLAPAFKDSSKRQWFKEVLDNLVKLWESNL